MPATVTLPVVGTVQRRYLIIGGASVAVIVGYVYLSRRRRGSAGASGTAFDPATGTPGSGDVGYVNPDPNGPPGPAGGQDTTAIRTNAEWGPRAVEALANVGYDPQAAAAAIGRYLTGQGLDALQEQMVRAAIGLVGYPPEGPPGIIKSQTAPTPGGTPTPPPPKPPGPTKKPAPPRRYVIVVKFTQPNPSWRSTLGGIAHHVGRSVLQLMEWNHIRNANLVHPGQKVWVDPPDGHYLGTLEIK